MRPVWYVREVITVDVLVRLSFKKDVPTFLKFQFPFYPFLSQFFGKIAFHGRQFGNIFPLLASANV
jgi:hypothetical protein